jgi:prefoldin subunit 5
MADDGGNSVVTLMARLREYEAQNTSLKDRVKTLKTTLEERESELAALRLQHEGTTQELAVRGGWRRRTTRRRAWRRAGYVVVASCFIVAALRWCSLRQKLRDDFAKEREYLKTRKDDLRNKRDEMRKERREFRQAKEALEEQLQSLQGMCCTET